MSSETVTLQDCRRQDDCQTENKSPVLVPMTVHREQNMKREDQQDATIR